MTKFPDQQWAYRKALKDRLSPPCGKPFKQLLHPSSVEAAEAAGGKKLVCYDCGVACDLEGMKQERLYFLRRMNAWTPSVPARRWMWPTRIVFSVAEPGRYRVKVRWSPYWHTSQGCLWRGADGTVRVQARNAGLVDLRVNVNVSRGLKTLTGLTPRRSCGGVLKQADSAD